MGGVKRLFQMVLLPGCLALLLVSGCGGGGGGGGGGTTPEPPSGLGVGGSVR